MDYQQKREKFKASLSNLEKLITRIFTVKPKYRELKNADNLIRLIWTQYPGYKAESILRIARTVRFHFDTEKNQAERANAECAYREFAQNRLNGGPGLN